MCRSDAQEGIAGHPLECGSEALQMQRVITTAKVKSDPYNGESIQIDDEEVNALVGEERLKRCIYRYLLDGSLRPFRTETSESVIGLRGFLSCQWNEEEVTGALESLDDSGVIVYADDERSRICLV